MRDYDDVTIYTSRPTTRVSDGLGVGLRRILPPTRFTIPGSTSAQQDVTLVRFLPMTGVVSGLLVQRLHSISVQPVTGQRFLLVLQPMSLCDEAPDLEFVAATGEVTGQTIDVGVTTATPPILYTTALSAPVPPGYRLVARITGAGTVPVTLTMSADLLGRDA